MPISIVRSLGAAVVAGGTLFLSQAANAIILVQTSDPGYYNNSIGTVLNLSNTGSDTCAEPFPTGNDCTNTYPIQPNLSAAGSILGNWLGDPLHLNSHWSASPIAIPNSWAVNTEVAIIYEFDTLGATNVQALFGVDNGMFVWLDGVYKLGARAGGGPSLGEYSVNIGTLTAGTHFLELLLEDHGATNGYAVQITADTFIPGPPPNRGPSVPEPGSLSLLGLGLAGWAVSRRKKKA